MKKRIIICRSRCFMKPVKRYWNSEGIWHHFVLVSNVWYRSGTSLRKCSPLMCSRIIFSFDKGERCNADWSIYTTTDDEWILLPSYNHSTNFNTLPASRIPQRWFFYKPVEQVRGMPRLVGSHEFFSQEILIAMGIGTARNLLELGNKLSLEHSELCVFLI